MVDLFQLLLLFDAVFQIFMPVNGFVYRFLVRRFCYKQSRLFHKKQPALKTYNVDFSDYIFNIKQNQF
ncbi:hypothetical protein CDL62_17815 [Alkalitalea saponilacus]|nr:hypothetical protein CDL62_17815 [Alkalitalea saponilacus]